MGRHINNICINGHLKVGVRGNGYKYCLECNKLRVTKLYQPHPRVKVVRQYQRSTKQTYKTQIIEELNRLKTKYAKELGI
jgi:hypothetical protein